MTNKRNRRLLLAATVVGLILTLTGCSEKYSEPFKDAPREAQANSDPAKVIEMPDGFNNLATKCIAVGIRGTVVYHQDSPYGAVSTVADPRCK